MTRIDELQERYPTIPKDVIVKWEVNSHGIADSRDLDKVSRWETASQRVYQSEDEDLTIERLKKDTPWRVRGNAVLVPDRLWMKSGLGLRLNRREQSSYVIREVSDGRFAIFEGDEMIDLELYAPPRQERHFPELKTSKGTPVQDLVEVKHSCFAIVPVRFCEYFTSGDECKFCNFNHTQIDASSAGLKHSVTINPDETAEAFRIIGSEIRLLDGYLVNGGFRKSETEASVNCKFVEKLNSSLPYEPYIRLHAEAMPRRELIRLRDAGLTGLRMQMETFDERLFPIINPGKAKHLPREGWLEAYQEAVEVFGAGNVGAKFIAGVTLLGSHGFKTWQEARDSHLEGNRWMIKHGVFPSMEALRWAPGSPFSRDPTNREKFPPTEFFLDLAAGHRQAMLEYGLYEKLNRFLYCAMDDAKQSGAEVGIVEIAGDAGTWMSKVVPYEHNWLAQFLDSMKSPPHHQCCHSK